MELENFVKCTLIDEPVYIFLIPELFFMQYHKNKPVSSINLVLAVLVYISSGCLFASAFEETPESNLKLNGS